MEDCVFCKIINKQIPSNMVYEDAQVYAFHDIAPQAPTHFVVIPKTHICSALDITQEHASLVGHCFAVIANVVKDMGLESYRVVTNCGESAGQSIFHLHFHVFAGRDMAWPPG